MLLSADWVLPIAQPPIRDGAVIISGDRVIEIGMRADLARRYPDEPAEHYSGCTITPGLVNAHTHLTLSALAGVLAPAPFAEWLPRLVAALKPWDIADHEASGIVGAEECLAAGVTCVGDIAYGAAEVAQASNAGLGGVFYWELLGIGPDEIPDTLSHLRYPGEPDHYGERVTCGLSPHSVYTSGPGLLRAVRERALAARVPTAIHVAESSAEVELLLTGTGPLAGTAERTAIGFTPPGTSAVAYLDDLGVLEATTAVHVCHADEADIATMARRVRGVVTCPRSNRYLANPLPSVASLQAAGIAVGIGTDSSASNVDLDLLAECRAVHEHEPTLSPETLLRAATSGGAHAIGVQDRFGTLQAGRFADIVLFGVAGEQDPERAVLERGGRETVRAVMSSGEWRVRDGRLLESDPAAAARAADARERSVAALAETQRRSSA